MAGNYEKNLYKHNQKLTNENEKLKEKIARIESETTNKYMGVIDKLNETIEAVLKRCVVRGTGIKTGNGKGAIEGTNRQRQQAWLQV